MLPPGRRSEDSNGKCENSSRMSSFHCATMASFAPSAYPDVYPVHPEALQFQDADLEMSYVENPSLTTANAEGTSQTKPTTKRHRISLCRLCSSLCTIQSQVLHGFGSLRIINSIFQILWILVVCSTPILTCVFLRYLFAPSSSIGRVPVETAQWYGVCYLSVATIVYGFRQAITTYVATRFTHRAQITVAKAFELKKYGQTKIINLGHHIRSARRCVMDDVPAIVDGALQCILFTIISTSQSTMIGLSLIVVLQVLFLLHLGDNFLHSAKKLTQSAQSITSATPIEMVHEVASKSYDESLISSIIITITILLEFSSPLIFFYFCSQTLENSKNEIEEFNLFLSFVTAICAVASSKCAHSSTRKALSKLPSVRVVVDLDLGRNVKGWSNSSNDSKKKCCNTKISIFIFMNVIILTTIGLLIASGSQLTTFGCGNVIIECTLGDESTSHARQSVILTETQEYDLATGCKIKSDSSTLLNKCLVACSVATGYGEIEDNYDDEVGSNNDTNSSSLSSYNDNLDSSSIDFGNYTNVQVLKAAAGKTKSTGGLNIGSIREILKLNNFDISGSRSTLEVKLQSMLLGSKTNEIAEDDNIDPSIRSVNQLLLDGSHLDVQIQATWKNWLMHTQKIQSMVKWSEVAKIALATNKANPNDVDEEQQNNSDKSRDLSENGTNNMADNGKDNWDIKFIKPVTSKNLLDTSDYTLDILVGSKYSDASKDTLTIKMDGEFGTHTGYYVVGNNWQKGEKRKVVLKGLKEVGQVTQITVLTSGKDGVLIEGLTVSHKETIVDRSSSINDSSSSSSSPSTSAATLDTGSEVEILSGKYMNCIGKIEKFSLITGKPKVCRDCRKKTAGKSKNGDCCGSSSCGYYKISQIKQITKNVASTDDDSENTPLSSKLKFNVGDNVKVLNGKYVGCMGSIIKFSASTSRPNICRDCEKYGSKNQKCCGTTTRTKCMYYDFNNIEKIGESGSASPAKVGRDLSSYFSMKTALKCFGSKRKGTWSCAVTLQATRPPNDTIDPHTSSSANPLCATKGQPGWQGDAPIISSTFKKSPALHGPLEYSFGKLWVDENAKGVRRFQYEARKDCGRLNRHGSFKIDKKYKSIQQKTGKAYPKHCQSPQRHRMPWSLNGLNSEEIKDQCVKVAAYDRGHLIPANHFDDNKNTITETNYVR
jgi:transcription antitermination factor NusG